MSSEKHPTPWRLENLDLAFPDWVAILDAEDFDVLGCQIDRDIAQRIVDAVNDAAERKE